MATFRCGKCGCSDDTALCNYWSARVRDMSPVCSACDPKIGKWHGQFPRLFGPFLVTPTPTTSPREFLTGLVGRLQQAEAGASVKLAASSGPAGQGVMAPGGAFRFDDPVPSYKPVIASPARRVLGAG